MRSHKKKFCGLESQLVACRKGKIYIKCSSRQTDDRQYSRWLGLLKHQYGGNHCLKQFIKDETFTKRRLPPLKPFDQPREVVQKSEQQAQRSKRKYFENLDKDLMDPDGASRRKTLCFDLILHAMEEAKAGKRFFYPLPEEQAAQAGVAMASMEGSPVDDKGKGAGKGKPTWHFIHYNLLAQFSRF